MSEVTRTRHIVKTITWRITGSSATFLVAYLVSGNLDLAGAIGISQIVLNTVLYYMHERIWYKYIKIGLKGKEDAQ